MPVCVRSAEDHCPPRAAFAVALDRCAVAGDCSQLYGIPKQVRRTPDHYTKQPGQRAVLTLNLAAPAAKGAAFSAGSRAMESTILYFALLVLAAAAGIVVWIAFNIPATW